MKTFRLSPVIFCVRLLMAIALLPALSFAQAALSYWVDPVVGLDTNPGTMALPFQHIGYAWTVAQANNLNNQASTINLNAGTYRESVTMNSATGATSALVTFQPSAGATGKVVWSGGTLYTGWTTYSGNKNVYTHAWTNDYPVCMALSSCSDYLQEEIILHQEMVTVNGSVLTQVLSLDQLLYPGTFYVDNTTSTIYVWPASGTDMATATVDIPTQSSLLTTNGVSNLLFDGIVFQYANSCRIGAAVTVNGGSYITFDSDTFQWNNSKGLDIANPATNITVENSVANYNGNSGFESTETLDDQWISNVAEANNWRGAQGGLYGCSVAGQHVWRAHGDTYTNDTVAWNQAYGIHWDTDNRNDATTGLISADNLLSGVFIEKNEGPLSLSDSYICDQPSSLSLGGLNLRNSGYDSDFNAVDPGISITNSYIYNNNVTEIVVQGQAGGLWVPDWQTNANYNLITGNFTNTANIIEGVGTGQQVFTDGALNGSDWTDFQTTLISDNNDWWNSSNTTTPFTLPVPAEYTLGDFATWQSTTLQDLIGSTFSAPVGNPFTSCDAVAAPAIDYWITVDNNSQTAGPTGAAVYNLTVTSLKGFAGTVNLAIDGIKEVKGLSATFSPASIAGGAGTSVLTVTSTDGSTPAGTYSITVIANNGNNTHTVTMQFVVPGSSLLYSTDNLVFPNQQVDTTSSALTVTLTNKGHSAMSFTSYTVTPSAYAISSNTCPASGGSLAGGKSCAISMTFTPNAAQLIAGTLSVVDGDVTSPQVVNLSGTGVAAPTVELSTSSLQFGDVAENGSSTLSFTLTNTGVSNLTISSTAISGTDPAMFTQTNNCPTPVLPNGICTFNVTFTPTNAAVDTATLTINDNTTLGKQTVTLHGTGALPRVSFTPNILKFGDVVVGSNSALTDTITNTGEVSLTITKIALTGSDTQYYEESDNCPRSPATLAAGATCVATVTFTPTINGSLTSTLTITDNTSAGSNTLSLTGTGAYPSVRFTPDILAFGRVTLGTGNTLTDTVTNKGAVALTITKIALTGSNTAYYKESDDCPRSPATLAAGGTCIATVTFTPTVSGALDSTLTITDNTSTGSSTLSLTGSGQ